MEATEILIYLFLFIIINSIFMLPNESMRSVCMLPNDFVIVVKKSNYIHKINMNKFLTIFIRKPNRKQLFWGLLMSSILLMLS